MEHNVDPHKDLSLYLQVKNILIKRIQEKVWPAHTLIPTEQELMKEFNVSRTTLRQAISILVQDGLLEKKQGKGTMVKAQELAGGGRLKGFAEEAAEKGLTPKSKLIRAEFRSDLYHEKSMLELLEEEEILVIERIRFADKVPIAIERSCWPAYIGEILMKHDLDTAKFYEILEAENITLKYAKDQIAAINATVHEADLLGIRGGEALLKIKRLSFGFDDRPLEYTITKYHGEKYHFDLELTR
ncbi:GntR family transcriptional regulator [Bacillus sp. HMSC76G11]|nr:GntR family transcriptional regulator [Bacillus sp. HMSC76G11]